MTGTFAIAKKELKCYFYSPIAYVIIGVFLFIMGMIFSAFIDIYQQYSAMQRFGQGQGVTIDKLISQLFQNMAFILCFITPMLTMKLFAEEKRQQTFELLFTAPIHARELVFGKFLASFLLMAIMVGISFVYVLFLILWGNPELPVIFTTYLGLFLALGCYLSLGAFISALSGSQAIAAVFTFIALIVLWLLQSLGQRVTAKWGPIDWSQVLVYVSPLGHFESFSQGLIHIKDIIYFVTFIGLMLFFTHRAVESNRWR